MIEDARRAGMDAQSLDHLRQALAVDGPEIDVDQEFDGIWPENVAIVRAFIAVASQWRVVPRSAGGMITPMGGTIAPTIPVVIGLDYAGVRAGLDAESFAVTPELWRGLRVMEAAACAAFNEDR
ncbi:MULTISPECIES: DUF1799 domain-containing protein [unclassified Bradyrhizobium]|uniref:DUF1799 domain-containing protein n=1 Tax=unclassified Bradyrhizobium TaxID=2631580 RepID=UPI002916FA14|nr:MULTISPECIES: DUF1799 domain-containing protein [unclassified Bradyrhizobium]